ncbi:MAG: bacteriorhodopsin-like [Elainellaceae cyanobacterium]
MIDLIPMASVPSTLSTEQFNLVYNAFSLCIAAMFAAALFFFNAKSQVNPKYRTAIVISGVVVSIAAYHYFRIFNSWEAAYTLQEGIYVATGELFNDAYRYVDWLLTVPLLLIETVAVLALSKNVSRPLFTKLAIAAVLMIGTGYPGEVADSITARAIWGAVSTIPFVYILYVLWTELNRAIERQPQEVKSLISTMRVLILFSWGVYPIAYLLPEVGITGATATVGVQLGYTIADLLAKPLFGLMLFNIALVKSDADDSVQVAGANGSETSQPTQARENVAATN